VKGRDWVLPLFIFGDEAKSEKRKAKSEKRKAKSEKRKAKSEKRKAKSEKRKAKSEKRKAGPSAALGMTTFARDNNVVLGVTCYTTCGRRGVIGLDGWHYGARSERVRR
jgi:hypothetical protein